MMAVWISVGFFAAILLIAAWNILRMQATRKAWNSQWKGPEHRAQRKVPEWQERGLVPLNTPRHLVPLIAVDVEKLLVREERSKSNDNDARS